MSPADGSNQSDVGSLAFGVRFLGATVAVALGLFDLTASYEAFTFKHIFEMALPGQVLPLATEFIIRFRVVWLMISFSLPIAAIIVAVFVRNHRTALTTISFLIVAISIRTALAWVAFAAPMLHLMSS